MKKLFFFALIFIVPLGAFAQEASEQKLIAQAMDGQRMIFERNYAGADELFTKVIKENPDHPIGYFGRMAVLEMKMLEREDFHLAREFETATKEGGAAIIKTLNRQPSDWDLLVCGSLVGLDGFFKARGRHWLDAYTRGVESRQTFHRIKQRNPAFVDADFGLGMYIYWRSVFTKELKILPFFPDRRAEGIAIVESVARDGSFAKELAEVNLGMIFMEEKQFDRSHDVFKAFSNRYPKNVILMLFDGKALIAGKRYDEAAATMKRLIAVDPSVPQAYYFMGMARVMQQKPEYYDEAEAALKKFEAVASKGEWKASANYWLGRLAELRGDKAAAKTYYETALAHNPNIKSIPLRIRALGSGL